MIELTGGEAIVRALGAENVSTVFGLTGGKLSALMSAFAKEPSLRFVGARHEGGAALMAAGYSAATGRLGVVLGECGGGAVNLVPGLAVANANSLPLLAITSNNQHAVSYPARGMFAGMDTEALFRPVTKWGTAVHDGRRLPELVRTALREAHGGRHGAVHLDVPHDVLRALYSFDEREFDAQPRHYRVTDGPAPTAMQVREAATLLTKAQRPLLIAGGGVVQAGATTAFRALAQRLGAAATATQSALGVVASEAPGFVGHATVTSGPAFQAACREADVILAVGCRLSPWLWDDQGLLFDRSASLIQVGTDPAMLGQHSRLALAILSDARIALEEIMAAVGESTGNNSREWLDQLGRSRREYLGSLERLSNDDSSPMHPAALAAAIARALPREAVVSYDGGHTTFWTNDLTPVTAPRTRFHEVGMSQLGFGLPYAMAAKIARPEVPAFNITGDGAFGFTIQELDAARRYGVPVVNIVHNNRAWGVIRHAHRKGFGFTLGDELEGTDYAAIARGFGCHGAVVTRTDEVGPAIEAALASGQPAVIDCRVRFEPHPGLADFGRLGSFGLPPAR
jgi:acetolactate synthase-1/2/3 large subunit